VAYNSLLLKRRKEIHGKIALAIEELYAERLPEFYEMLAYHYSRSENMSKACHYLKLSGDKAKGSFSPLEAFNFYKKAVNLLRDQPVTQDNKRARLEILRGMTYPMRMLGHPEGSFEFLVEGESLAQELQDQKAQPYFQTTMGLYYLTAGGDPVKGRDYIERGLEGSELTEEIEIIVPAIYDLLSSQIVEGRYLRVCLAAPKVIALIEKTHREHEPFGATSSNQYSILQGYYGQSLGAIGNFAEGERFLEKGLSFARDIDNLISLAMIEMGYGVFCFYKGDVENQLNHYRSSIDYMEKSQFRIFLGPLWAWLGGGYLLLGETDRTLQYTEKGLKMHTDLNIPFFLGSIHWTLCEIHLKLGNFEKAHVHGQQAVDLSKRNNERYFEAEARMGLGRVIAARDGAKFDEALELVLQGIAILDELQIRPRYAVGLLYLGELYAGVGQREEALENVKKAESMFRKMGMDYWLGMAQELLAAL